MTIPQLPADKEQEYYRLLSKIESNDNPRAKAKSSSASGRFQFIKSTWEGLGYDWDDVFNDALQWEAAERFTRANAERLINAGCAINFATLYGAHFLGTAGFLRVMRGSPSDPISSVTSAAQRKANPTILKGTIKDFTDWLERKTGDDYRKRYAPEAPIIIADPEPPHRAPNILVPIIIFLVVVGAVAAYVFLS